MIFSKPSDLDRGLCCLNETIVLLLNALIEKGGGNRPDDALATVLTVFVVWSQVLIPALIFVRGR